MLLVNLISGFRVSLFQQFLPVPAATSLPDRIVEVFVSSAVEMKAFAIFSFLFGVGLAVQFERLTRRGSPFYWLTRRLVVLLLFGLVHLLFIWNGDILTEYALIGLLAMVFLRAPTWGIAGGAATCLLLYLAMPLLPLPIPWPDVNMLQQHVANANVVYASGGLLDIWRFSLQELTLLLPLHVWVMPRTMALVLLGMLVWRTGLLQHAEHYRQGFWTTAGVGIVVGAMLTVAGATGALSAWGQLGAAVSNLAPMVLATGYAALVLALLGHPVAANLIKIFAPVGRMAFSNYILQSLVFGFIFFGYGLGYFGQLGATSTLLLGVGVYAAQTLLSTWWLTRFRYGPLEWLWRTLMYGQRQAMRRLPTL
ncbi:MAG: DUF418 domain-containing protein [Pseudomonadota bacterium]